jgi:RHS repeat-associated protein
LGDRLLVVYTASETYFNHINNLASTTMMTGHAGTAVEDIVFYPWGQNSWKFWGSGGYPFANMPYYDTNTSTSPTMFRFYSMNLGRWHSPDPLGGDVTNPQSLNRYAYVLNNPTTLIDPTGLDTGMCDDPAYAASHAECPSPPPATFFPAAAGEEEEAVVVVLLVATVEVAAKRRTRLRQAVARARATTLG